jgi:hypothetical protein
MRHLIGVVLAIVLAAAVFFAASWGFMKLLTGRALPASGDSFIHDRAVLEGFGVLLAVGLLAGLLIAVPVISPLASGLVGLALLAWTGLYLFSTRRAVQYIPLKSHAYGAGFEALLFYGVLALVGLIMVIPLFVPSRWRRSAAGPEFYDAAPDGYSDMTATQTLPSGVDLLGDWAETRPQPRVDPGQAQAPWGPAEPGSPGGSGSPPDYS